MLLSLHIGKVWAALIHCYPCLNTWMLDWFNGAVNRWLPLSLFSVFRCAGACWVSNLIYYQFLLFALGPVLQVLMIIIQQEVHWSVYEHPRNNVLLVPYKWQMQHTTKRIYWVTSDLSHYSCSIHNYAKDRRCPGWTHYIPCKTDTTTVPQQGVNWSGEYHNAEQQWRISIVMTLKLELFFGLPTLQWTTIGFIFCPTVRKTINVIKLVTTKCCLKNINHYVPNFCSIKIWTLWLT